MHKKIFVHSIAVLLGIVGNSIYCVRSLIIPRSQGVRLSREFNARYRDQENFDAAGSLTLTIERLQSQRARNIATCLFGSDTLNFSGSEVAGRRSTDLLADYFGLAPDFQGSVYFKPRIENLVVDLQYNLRLDCLKPGLLFSIDVPLARSIWNIGAHFRNGPTDALFPACYMSTSTSPVVGALNLQQALSGQITFGDMQRVWNFGKFSCSDLQIIRIANIAFTLTYPIIYSADIHFNVLLNACVPAGNKPDPDFIFSPIAGNGHFGTIGAGFNLTWHTWHTTYGSFSWYMEGRMSHLFKHKNIRSFDFRENGPLSRYMLLEQLNLVSDDSLVYGGELINGINFATRAATVYVPLEGEFLVAFAFDNDCWNANIGYTFYGRTREQLSLLCANPFPCDVLTKLFGIKGTAALCTSTTSTTITHSNATIYSGGTADDRPRLVSCCSLDPDSATVPHQITNTFFLQATRLWPHCRLSPYLGFGFETEFAAPSNPCSISQWGVWVSGGISF